MRQLRRWGRCGALGTVLALSAAGVTWAAASGAYRGKTSQKQPVSFRLSAGAVDGFAIVINDRCPDGHTLQATGHYPTMKVKHGRFGGSFVPAGGHRGEKATLHGRLRRHSVTGSLSDTSFSSREGALCHGSATFTATRH